VARCAHPSRLLDARVRSSLPSDVPAPEKKATTTKEGRARDGVKPSLSLPSSPTLAGLEEKGLRGGMSARRWGQREGGVMVLAAAEASRPGWGGGAMDGAQDGMQGGRRRRRPPWAH
jgi:hypothetical protein